jgi:cytochrome c peroxidase
MRGKVSMAAIAVACMMESAIALDMPSASELARMKAEYKRPAPRPVENKAMVELGRQLFWDKRVSASGNTACVTCHLPHLGYSVVEAKSRTDSGTLTSRKSQTLLGVGHQGDAPIGWDGRNASLEAQAKSSIATGSMSMRQTSTPVKVEVIEQRIRDIPEYAAKFQELGLAANIDGIAKAIAEYERKLEPGPAAFDRWVQGEESAISESAKRGFVVFNTKGNCFACHSGWRFADDLFHDIGTSTKDKGRGNALKDDPQAQFAFKTPTLRSVALRPPFMHDGSSATLLDTVKHYEKGGIERPSRSPLLQPIELSEQERLDLVAFMETLTGNPEGEGAPALPGMVN